LIIMNTERSDLQRERLKPVIHMNQKLWKRHVNAYCKNFKERYSKIELEETIQFEDLTEKQK